MDHLNALVEIFEHARPYLEQAADAGGEIAETVGDSVAHGAGGELGRQGTGVVARAFSGLVRRRRPETPDGATHPQEAAHEVLRLDRETLRQELAALLADDPALARDVRHMLTGGGATASGTGNVAVGGSVAGNIHVDVTGPDAPER